MNLEEEISKNIPQFDLKGNLILNVSSIQENLQTCIYMQKLHWKAAEAANDRWTDWGNEYKSNAKVTDAIHTRFVTDVKNLVYQQIVGKNSDFIKIATDCLIDDNDSIREEFIESLNAELRRDLGRYLIRIIGWKSRNYAIRKRKYDLYRKIFNCQLRYAYDEYFKIDDHNSGRIRIAADDATEMVSAMKMAVAYVLDAFVRERCIEVL